MEVIYVAGAISALLCTFIFDQLSLDILNVVIVTFALTSPTICRRELVSIGRRTST